MQTGDLFGEIAQLARAIGSYPIGREFKSHSRYHGFTHEAFRPVGQAAKTPPFHGGIMGSIPVRVTINLARKSFCRLDLRVSIFCKKSFCPSSVHYSDLLSFAVTYAPCFFLPEKSSTEAIASPALACACRKAWQ